MVRYMVGRRFGVPGTLPSLVLISAGLAGSLSAAAAPAVVDISSARERGLVAESFANEKLWAWQRRLNLHGWNISIIMAPPTDLKPKTLGNIHWDADKKSAVIRVLDASHYRLPFREMLQDMEFTVVHELIHLELSS